MKKVLKKILKWTGITLLLMIIALILIPIFFKDQLKELVIKEVNKTLTAELSLDDFDLTFLSTFPNMTIELYGARLTGKDQFEGVKIADIKEIKAHVGFWSVVMGDQVEIDEVHIIDPTFDVRVLEDGTANYDIVKPDSLKTREELEEPSSFKLSVKEYSVTNAMIKYDDRSLAMYAELDSVFHTGSGDLTAEIIDFETTTEMDKLSYTMDGIDYLTEVKTDAKVNILMEFTDKSSKFTLKENEVKLNEIDLSFDGFYELLDDHDDMDIKLNASEATFKEFLSLIPAFYHSGYESMVAKGDMKIKGEVKGKMDDENLPAWDFGLDVKNASINYPDLPGKITNIALEGGSIFPGGSDINSMKIEVPKFRANLDKNKIDANLYVRNMIIDPYIQSKIKANVDLATLKNYIPATEGESYKGELNADVNIKGNVSALERSDFEAFRAEGILELLGIKYKSKDLPHDVSIDNMKFSFAPEQITMDQMDAKMGKSDFHMNGKVENFFGYLFRSNEDLVGDFAYSSNYLDVDEIMGTIPETEETVKGQVSGANENVAEQPILVPENIDFKLNSKINKLRYNNLNFNNISGDITLKDEVAKLEGMQMNAMGGTVGLKGSYDTHDHSTPKLDFGYNLKDIDVNQLANNFITVDKLAPIAKFAQGKISSNFDMQTDLTSSFEPVLNTLSSFGDLRSNALKITNVKVLKKIEKVMQLKGLSNQTLENFKTKFSVDNGEVALLPFDVKLGKVNTNVSGYTTLDKKMNYDFVMDIPKEMIPASMIKEVEKAMSQLNALVPTLNMGELPAKIPVKINAAGPISDPKITSDFKEAILKATGDFKDDLITNVTQTVKDTIQSVVDDKVEDVKEEIEKQKKHILEEAEKQAAKVRAEAKTQADNIRTEADKAYEEAIKAAGSNPIKKKAAEAVAKPVRDKAYKKADDLEAEADKKAEEILRKAQEKADNLG
jgi:hypothetical protein